MSCSAEPRRWRWAAAARVFAFEATGHVWEALAYRLHAAGQRYVVVNPLATFRVREARLLSREKTDRTDAEQIAELCRTGMVTRTQLEAEPYLAVRRAWGDYRRLREERAPLKVLIAHQLYGLFPEFLRVWAELLQPGALAVLRTGLTPAAIASMSLGEFIEHVRQHRAGRRVWRYKLAQVHRYAEHSVACPEALEVLAREGSYRGTPLPAPARHAATLPAASPASRPTRPGALDRSA